MEEAHVVHTVSHHYEPVQPNVDVKAGPDSRIQARSLQDVRVRSAPRHYLDPPYVLADFAALSAAYETAHIYFKTRFNKGEEADPHPDLNVSAEYLVKDSFDKHLAGSE